MHLDLLAQAANSLNQVNSSSSISAASYPLLSSSSSPSSSSSAPQEGQIQEIAKRILGLNDIQPDVLQLATSNFNLHPECRTEKSILLCYMLKDLMKNKNQFTPERHAELLPYLLTEIQAAEDKLKNQREKEAADLIECFKKICASVEKLPPSKEKERIGQLFSLLSGAYNLLEKAAEIHAILNEYAESIFSKIEELDLSNLNLSSLPMPILSNFRTLKKLNLKHNNLTSLPPEIGRLTALQQLCLSENQLATLPDELPKTLTKLEIAHNALTELPRVIPLLVNLRELNLFGNRLTTLPNELTRLQNLKHLDVGANRFLAFPLVVCSLRSLEKLSLSFLIIKNLPEVFQNLKLLVLNLEGTQVSSSFSPFSFSPFINATQLTHLNLSNTQLNSLPPNMHERAPNLTTLSLANNRFQTFPGSLVFMPALQQVIFNGNSFFALPPEILASKSAVFNSEEIQSLRKRYLEMQKKFVPQAVLPTPAFASSSSSSSAMAASSSSSSTMTTLSLPTMMSSSSSSHSSASSSSSSSVLGSSLLNLAIPSYPSFAPSAPMERDDELEHAVQVIATKILNIDESQLPRATEFIKWHLKKAKRVVHENIVTSLLLNPEGASQNKEIISRFQSTVKALCQQESIERLEVLFLNTCFSSIVWELIKIPQIEPHIKRYIAATNTLPEEVRAEYNLKILNDPAYQPFFDLITELKIAGQGIFGCFPKIICQKLRNLQKLSIEGTNGVKEIPNEIGLLTHLEELNLSGPIRALPPELPKSIRRLRMTHNNLRVLPNQILLLTELQELSLADNHFWKMPQEITQLKNLRILDLHRNLINSIPANLDDLVNLEELHLYTNQLLTLPPCLAKMRALKRCIFYANPIEALPPEILFSERQDLFYDALSYRDVYNRHISQMVSGEAASSSSSARSASAISRKSKKRKQPTPAADEQKE